MHVLLGQEIREKIYKLLEAKKKKRERTHLEGNFLHVSNALNFLDLTINLLHCIEKL